MALVWKKKHRGPVDEGLNRGEGNIVRKRGRGGWRCCAISASAIAMRKGIPHLSNGKKKNNGGGIPWKGQSGALTQEKRKGQGGEKRKNATP